MRSFAKLRRDTRALSAVFAVLLLIAIAVIAGIIIYMFTSGYLGTMMGGGTAGQEKVAIESIQVGAPMAGDVTLWCKSTGGGPVIVTEVIFRDASGTQVGAPVLAVGVTLPATGVLTPVPVTPTVALVSGQTYTAALVSQAGNQFVSPSFKA